MCLLCMHGGIHFYSCVSMWKLMMFLLGCIGHECMLIVYDLVMHISIYMLLCMHVMVIVVLHEVIV